MELGMVILVSPLHPENAKLPMFVTLLGIVILVISLHPENAEAPIEVTEFGMMVFLHPAINVLLEVSMIALQLFRES